MPYTWAKLHVCVFVPLCVRQRGECSLLVLEVVTGNCRLSVGATRLSDDELKRVCP